MKFYVIYSVSCADKDLFPKIKAYEPRENSLKKLKKTEGNDSYEYDYLGKDWEGGSHFKYCGILNKEEFSQLMIDGDLVFEDCETMGSLTEFGHLPALSYRTENNYSNVIGSCYVTPLPDVKEPLHDWTSEEIDQLPNDFKEVFFECVGMIHDKNWKRIRKAMKSVFPY